MTSAEHYAEAESCLKIATEADSDADPAEVGLLLRFAQVHATLAVAADRLAVAS